MKHLLLILFLLKCHVFIAQMDSLVLHNPQEALRLAEEVLDKPNEYPVRERIKWSLIAQESALNLAYYDKSDLFFENAKNWKAVGADTLYVLEMYRHAARNDAIQNRLETAFEKYSELLNYYERKGDEEKMALIKVNMAEYYRIVQKYHLGEQLLRDVLQDKDKLDSSTIANAYHRLAAIEVQMNVNLDEGIRLSNLSLKYSEPLGQLQHMATSYSELGYIYYNQQNSISRKYYQKALDIWYATGHHHYQAHTLNNLARYYIQKEDYKEAEKSIEESIAIGRNNKIESTLYDALNLLANLYNITGKHENAYELRDSAAEMQVQVLYKQYNRDINELSQAYTTELALRKLHEVEKQSELAQAKALKEIQEKKWLRAGITVMGGGSILVLIFLIRIRNRNTEIRKQKNIIEKQNFDLNQSNQEKDILLQEVHHRVKNNLQLILALLEFQDERYSGEETRKLIEDIGMRISAIAIVHNQLYDEKHIGEIMVDQYINELVHQVLSACIGKKTVDIDMAVQEINLSLSQSIALGMITNELLINALKYAFPKSTVPKLSISLNCTGNTCEYIFRDNGPGMELQVDSGLGMRLIEIFSRQLKGRYNFVSDNGLIFIFKFPQNEISA